MPPGKPKTHAKGKDEYAMKAKMMTPAFFTRAEKPTLRPVLMMSAVAAGLIAALLATGAEKHALFICVTMAVYSLGVSLGLARAFREQLRYDPYSYNTIFYIGFALFALSVMLTYAILAVRMARQPDVYRGIMVVNLLLSSAKTFMFYSSPFLLLFSGGLCISNVALIRHEGKRPVNLLGIVLSFLLLGGWAFLFVFDYAVSGSVTEVMLHDLAANLFAAIYLYFECMLIGTIIADAVTARYEPKKDKDYVIILGCRVRKDGTPTPLLQGRVDRAVRFYEAQKRETGKAPTFVTSGGQGADEAVSESASMKRYLMDRGIPAEQIIEEDRSTSTLENMRFSKEKILSENPAAKIAFSTSNYHVFRSGFFASSEQMRAEGMGAKTKWYFWPNAAVREFAGLLARQRLGQALILGAMIVFYVSLTLFYFLSE